MVLFLRLLPIVLAAGLIAGCAKTVSQSAERASAGETPLGSLAGSEWSETMDSDQFVHFGGNGQMNGMAGCNSFHGTYAVEDGRLTIGPLATTRKMCPPEIMEKEQVFLSLFEKVDHIDATHTQLTLYDADNNVLSNMVRRDWD